MSHAWILVADHARARLFEQHARTDLREVEDFINPDGRGPARERATTERPPRTQESVGSARHAIEPHTDAKQKIAVQFVQQLSSALDRGLAQHRFDELVLVAPPHFLGTLDAGLSDQVRRHVCRRIGKDLTRLPAQRISEAVADDRGAA